MEPLSFSKEVDMDVVTGRYEAVPERAGHCKEHGVFIQKGMRLYAGGRVIWMMCSQCEKEEIAAEQKREAELKQMRMVKELETMLGRACLPKRFVGKTFDSFIVQTKAQAFVLGVAKRYAQEFDEHRRNGTGLIFMGSYGTGKSHLAGAIMQQVMPQYQGLYITVADCVRMVRECWRSDAKFSEAQVLKRFGEVDLLVLDEVGKQYGSESEQHILLDLLDMRYRECRPTILMGNVKTSELHQYVGERVVDRLREANKAIVFDWESYRKSGR